MELFLVARVFLFFWFSFYKQANAQILDETFAATRSKYSGEVKVFDSPVNRLNYLSAFKLHLPVETRA